MGDKTELNLARIRACDAEIWRTINDAEWDESKCLRAKNGRFSKWRWTQSGPIAVKQKKRTLPVKKSLKLSSGDGKIYKSIDKILHGAGLLNEKEKVLKPKPIKITDVGSHAIDHFMLDRQELTIEDAQSYVDNALVMVQQTPDKFCFIAEDGTAIVLDKGRLVSVFSKKYYDPNMKRKVEMILECLTMMTTE